MQSYDTTNYLRILLQIQLHSDVRPGWVARLGSDSQYGSDAQLDSSPQPGLDLQLASEARLVLDAQLDSDAQTYSNAQLWLGRTTLLRFISKAARFCTYICSLLKM